MNIFGYYDKKVNITGKKILNFVLYQIDDVFLKKSVTMDTMEKETNIIDITQHIKPSEKVDSKFDMRAKTQSNPIFKKNLVISVKNNIHKFSVADLFD